MEKNFIADEYTSIVQRNSTILSKDKIQNLENYWKTIENRLIFIKKDNPTVVKDLKTQMDNIVSLLKSKQKTQEKENITLTNDDKEEINTKLSEFNDFIKKISQNVKGFDKIKEVIDGFRNTYYDLIDISGQQNSADNNIELFTTFNINIDKDIINIDKDIINIDKDIININKDMKDGDKKKLKKYSHNEKKKKRTKESHKEYLMKITTNMHINSLKTNKYSEESLKNILFDKYEVNGYKKIKEDFKTKYLQNENYEEVLERYFTTPILVDFMQNYSQREENRVGAYDVGNMIIEMVDEVIKITNIEKDLQLDIREQKEENLIKTKENLKNLEGAIDGFGELSSSKQQEMPDLP